MNPCRVIASDTKNDLEKFILTKAARAIKGRPDRDIFDLHVIYGILTSTGTNKNADHFDPVELWRARHSCSQKPINIGHNQVRVIGHMLDSIVVAADDLKPIPEDTDEADLPYKLHLCYSGVIYKIWEDPKVQAEINTIIDKITKGTIFCSMECLFRDFAFLLTNASTGEQRLLPRNDKTAGLTKYLRQYRGPGKLYNYTLARVLKDLTFSAVGIVEQPANTDSIFSNSLDFFSTASVGEPETTPKEYVYINLDVSHSGDNISMADKVETVIAIEQHPKFLELRSEFDSLAKSHELMRKDNDFMHARIGELNKSLAESQQELTMAKTADDKKEKDDKVKANDGDADDEAMASLKAQIDSLTKEVASLKESLAVSDAAKASLESSKASIDAEKAELVKANDAMKATIDEFKKASRHNDRAEALMLADAGLTREKALEKVKAMDEMADSTFASMCEMIKGYAARAPKEVTAESILANAKAEASPPLGAQPENEFTKTTADIKKFLTSKKGA